MARYNFRAYARACKDGLVEPGRMFVHDAGGVWQQFTQPHAGPAMLFETENRRRDRKILLAGRHAREPLAAAHGVRQLVFEALA